MNVEVTPLCTLPPSGLALEIVERKGLGHPDTICDALAENLSNALSRLVDPRVLPERCTRIAEVASARLETIGTMWRTSIQGALVQEGVDGRA